MQRRSDPVAPPPKSAPRATAAVKLMGFRGTDEELLERLHRDGNAAAGLLHDRFSAEVNGLVWRLLGPDNDHDDIVQTVFCRLLLHVGKVREADRLASWVRSITVNAVYSELRKRSVRRIFWKTESSKPEQYLDGGNDVESRDLLQRVYAELERMPAAERVAFCLRYVDGKQLAEVAELCDCSLATIKRRLQKAEAKLEPLRDSFEELER